MKLARDPETAVGVMEEEEEEILETRLAVAMSSLSCCHVVLLGRLGTFLGRHSAFFVL
jgi:hypothetical protein